MVQIKVKIIGLMAVHESRSHLQFTLITRKCGTGQDEGSSEVRDLRKYRSFEIALREDGRNN